MIAWDNKVLCSRYAEFYYDFLYHRSEVPEEVQAHFSTCPDCRRAIQKLKSNLASELSSDRNPQHVALMTNLELHMAHIGKSVTCRKVRPFLPSQVDPSLRVHVPTPITIHIDHCDSCKTCLEKIRCMNLNQRQLCRLSQMIAEAETAEQECEQNHPALKEIAELQFHKQEPAVLKHVSVCTRCRQSLYEYREQFLDRSRNNPSWADRDAVCDNVSNQDLFEYCFPYGMEPSGDEYAKFRPALLDHIRQCASCIAKMQTLHTLVDQVLEEPASGLITRITLRDVPANHTEKDLPWHVEIRNSADSSDIAPQEYPIETAGKEKGKGNSFYPLRTVFRSLAAAAIFIVIAYIVVSSLPSARAVDFETLYKTMSQADCVYLQIYNPDQTELVQEILVSQSEQIYAIRNKNQIVLQDLNNAITRTKDRISGLETTQSLSEEATRKLHVSLDTISYVMPFKNISDVPKEAEWKQVLSNTESLEEPQTELFTLTWTEPLASGQVRRSWRVHIDPEQGLPLQTEQWEQIPGMQQAERTASIILHYPTSLELTDMIAAWGF
ncbi:MAG: hypothetical protein JXA82_10120 [Sedimentisphaerales bacterium]|nr:hypothetical protein [Sedimentisphaerales bacterium]